MATYAKHVSVHQGKHILRDRTSSAPKCNCHQISARVTLQGVLLGCLFEAYILLVLSEAWGGNCGRVAGMTTPIKAPFSGAQGNGVDNHTY